MYSPAQQGFGRIVSQGGANVLGGLAGRSLGREANLAGASLAGKSAMNAAEARGKAIRYQGRQQGKNAIMSGLFGGLGSIASGFAAGNFGGGGGGTPEVLTNPTVPGFSNPTVPYSAYKDPNFYTGGFGGFGF